MSKTTLARDWQPADGEPHGWIQWKGTSVCMDVRCSCGHQGHVDLDFFYYWECRKCGRAYAVGATVRMIPLTDNEKDSARLSNSCYHIDEPNMGDEDFKP